MRKLVALFLLLAICGVTLQACARRDGNANPGGSGAYMSGAGGI